jgi:hypothetical protein
MRLSLLLFLITTPLFATETAVWCRAEPVSTNGDDYIKYDNQTEESACAKALKECEAQYTYCEITGCGKVESEKSFDSRICRLLENSLMGYKAERKGV